MSRHVRLTTDLASPRNLRLAALVLSLIAVNQINDPLVEGEATVGQALLFWGVRPLVLAGGLWLADWLVARYLAARLITPEWLKPVVLVSAIGLLPLALTEVILEQYLPFRPEFLDDELWAYSPVLAFLGEFATAATVIVPVHLLLWLIIDKSAYGSRAVNEQTEPYPAPEFLQRKPDVRVEDVLALQAEEHYVRIHLRDSTDLVHCRFGNAVKEMPAELGLQVHRSWWVAETAVRSAKRGARRWQLDLVTGVAVPVSDSFVQAVRERGWLSKKQASG